MKKKGTNTENVYELIQKRLKFIFDEFDNIYVCLLYTSPSPRD